MYSTHLLTTEEAVEGRGKGRKRRGIVVYLHPRTNNIVSMSRSGFHASPRRRPESAKISGGGRGSTSVSLKWWRRRRRAAPTRVGFTHTYIYMYSKMEGLLVTSSSCRYRERERPQKTCRATLFTYLRLAFLLFTDNCFALDDFFFFLLRFWASITRWFHTIFFFFSETHFWTVESLRSLRTVPLKVGDCSPTRWTLVDAFLELIFGKYFPFVFRVFEFKSNTRSRRFPKCLNSPLYNINLRTNH